MACQLDAAQATKELMSSPDFQKVKSDLRSIILWNAEMKQMLHN